MPAYYNEIDAFAAQWLRNLIKAGHIAPGDVDTRSIEDVHPDDLKGYEQCHFFAGIGVWSHALRSAGWPDDREVWTGSCPCQPFSEIGKGAGTDDERHLWPALHRLISERRPDAVFGEQVEAAIKHQWVDLVHTDLERSGYAVATFGLPAPSVGAPHIRARLYWVGDADYEGLEGHSGDGYEVREEGPTGSATPPSRPVGGFWGDAEWLPFMDGKRRPVQPGLRPMADRSPNHVGRCRAYGNAIVAPLAAEFIGAYMDVKGITPQWT